MSTAFLSVDIKTDKALRSLQELKNAMRKELRGITLALNTTAFTNSIQQSLNKTKFKISIDSTALGTQVSRAVADASVGAGKVEVKTELEKASAARMLQEFKTNLATMEAANDKFAKKTSVKGGTSSVVDTAAGIAALEAQAQGIKKVGTAHHEATGKTKAHTAAMHDAHSAARGLASGMGMMWLTWGNIAPLLAGASLSHGFIQAMKAGSEFAYQLTFVKALGGETSESVRGIGAAALEMSKNGLYGPVELANGLRVLGQAGIATKDALVALPQVFDLATVGEMSMSDAAITLAGVMTAFNLQVKDMSHIGDVFSKAAAESQTSVEQMTQAMKTASVVGYQYGASMEDTATALTLLAKMNITGTAAGTSLRNMLKELYSPTDKAASIMKNLGLSAQTAAGELKPFPDVIFSMKSKLEQFNKASQVKILQGMFGERGAKEAIAMLSLTRDKWDDLNKTISESGGFMAKVSSELEATTKGSFKQAINTLQANLVEAFGRSEGAAGALATRLKQVFDSNTFKAAIDGILTGMLTLTNTLVAIGPVLATVAAGWVAVKAAMVAGAVWTMTAAAITNVSMTLKAFTLVATGAATAVGGTTGLMAALRMVLGPFGLVLTAVTAVTAALGYLYNRMSDYGPAQIAAQNANAAASAMENLANKTAAATAEFRRMRLEKEGKTEVGDARSGMQQREQTYKDQKALLDALNKAQVTDSISGSRGGMISALTSSLREQRLALDKERTKLAESEGSYREGLKEKSRGAYLDADSALRDMPRDGLKQSQVAAKKVAQGTAEYLQANTETIIATYGEQAAYVLDRIQKNLAEQVQDAKVASGTKNADAVLAGGGGGGRADREAAKLENANVKSLEDKYKSELRIADAHYSRLEKVERASAQYGIKTREEAEDEITRMAEDHWTTRLKMVEGMSSEMSELLGKSAKLSDADRKKAESFIETAKAEIDVLKEKITWSKEEARLRTEGEAVQRKKELGKSAVDLEKIRQQYAQKVLGDGMTPTSRVRNEGELQAKDKYDQQLQNALTKVNTARKGGNLDAIMDAETQYEEIVRISEEAKKATGDHFVKVYEQSQTAEHGWKSFWEKYQESALTSAKVVEQSLDSVTKHVEDAFSEMFTTGTFDYKKMVNSILADTGRLVAKMAVADIGSMFNKDVKNSGSILGGIFGMKPTVGPGGMISEEGAFKKPEGLAGVLTDAVSGIKNFWNSLTGATNATEGLTKSTTESVTKTALSLVQTTTKQSAEQAATASLISLSTAAQMAATSLSMGKVSGGGGSSGLGGILSMFGGTGAKAASTAATYGTIAGSQQTAMLALQDAAFLAAKGAAFDHNTKAFALGGVVNTPTNFRFADGGAFRTGLMGEAGPEGILPLARDSYGRLGVRYEGREPPSQERTSNVNNTNINVSVNSTTGDPAEIRRATAAGARSAAGYLNGARRYA